MRGKMVRYKKMKLSLPDVYSIKCEALLVVISLLVVYIDASSLNSKKIIHSFCEIITIYIAGISLNKMRFDPCFWVKLKQPFS